VSQNHRPVQIVLDDSLYQAIASRRSAHNAELVAQGLPPAPDRSSLISESQAKAEQTQDEARRAASKSEPPALPRPSRGLRSAAKAKAADRNSSIPDFERHSRKCQICRNPYVDIIETAYLQWNRTDLICRYFRIDDSDTLYRHVRAAGLDVLRRQNVRVVVENFIEHWQGVKITAPTILRSIRALSCLDEKGRWTDPPSTRTHILLRGNDGYPSADPSASLPEMGQPTRFEKENQSLDSATPETKEEDSSLLTTGH
jgi:hypothetical protein